MKEYSFRKTLGKGVTSGLIALAALVTFAGMNDISLWALIEEYVKPLVGSITVGGLIAMAINYTKFHLISKYE